MTPMSKKRNKIVKRDGPRCFYCGIVTYPHNELGASVPPSAMTVDHVLPASTHVEFKKNEDNLIIACRKHNLERGHIEFEGYCSMKGVNPEKVEIVMKRVGSMLRKDVDAIESEKSPLICESQVEKDMFPEIKSVFLVEDEVFHDIAAAESRVRSMRADEAFGAIINLLPRKISPTAQESMINHVVKNRKELIQRLTDLDNNLT